VAATAGKDAAARDKVAADKAVADKAAAAEAEKARAQKAQIQAQTDAETARAKALLEGKTPQAKPVTTAAADTGRFIVQFGAFGDATKAREARQKVEKTGLKTYSQVAKTADGERIRVRVGPFATKAEADKAAGKIKTLGLPAAVLTL
jgi:DedD protein